MKKFVDISSFITISHFHVYEDFVLDLHFLDIISVALHFNHSWTPPLYSLCYSSLNGAKNV